ncbi:MAG: glutathione S-transferase family protein [Pseudomonadota bacterium]
MYKLYWAADSGALAPQILLEEAGVEYEREIYDLEAGDEYSNAFLAINPRGQIPALTLPDGNVITESAAICLHIAESFPDANLLPAIGSAARAQVYRWLMYSVANLYETVLRLYYSDRYTTDAENQSPVEEMARTDLDRAWALLDAELGDGPFVLGADYSIIDPYLLMLINWHEQPDELRARHPKLGVLYASVLNRQATQRIWTQHFP